MGLLGPVGARPLSRFGLGAAKTLRLGCGTMGIPPPLLAPRRAAAAGSRRICASRRFARSAQISRCAAGCALARLVGKDEIAAAHADAGRAATVCMPCA